MKKIFILIFLTLIVSASSRKVYSANDYSGYCVYPGGVFKINFLSQFKPADNYTVSIDSEHSAVEIYKEVGSGAVNPVLAGRYLLSDVIYVKFKTVSGPYLKLTFNIFDKSNNLVGKVDSGKICNLSWWRDKHGSFVHPVPEKEVSSITAGILSLHADENDRTEKTMIFCVVCFVLGSLMGTRTPKMIEYLGEKGG